MLPVGFGKRVELAVSVPRICCSACGAVRQIALPFADPKNQYTHALERCVIDLCRITTLQHVTELTGLGWDTVKAIHHAKAPQNLQSHADPKKDERVRLQAALALNQPLATAYYMKERLRLLFQAVDAPCAFGKRA